MEDTLDKTSVEAIQRSEQEKPRNGIKGLIHWNQDLTAGAIVALAFVFGGCGCFGSTSSCRFYNGNCGWFWFYRLLAELT
jgi:hypothetical protein